MNFSTGTTLLFGEHCVAGAVLIVPVEAACQGPLSGNLTSIHHVKRPHGDSGVHGSPDSPESAGKQSGGSTSRELAIVDGGLGEAHV